MNLLLLLTALFSALTGVGGNMRAVEATQAVAATSIATAVVAERTVVAMRRPVAALPVLAAVAGATTTARPQLVTNEPLYASRRRE